ncbi:MAG: hypothetical protein ACJAQ6_001196, partial [Arenicella sp.]
MLHRYTKASLIGLGLITSLPILFIYSAALYARYEQPDKLLNSQSASAKTKHYVIEPVSVVDVENGTVETQRQLMIADGVIVGIDEAGHQYPTGYAKINGSNAYVTPGLIDMHTHIIDRIDLVNSLAHGVTSVRNMHGMPMHLRFKSELQNNRWLGSSIYSSSPILNNAESDVFQHGLHSPEQAAAVVRKYKRAGYDLLKVYSQLPKPILDAVLKEA